MSEAMMGTVCAIAAVIGIALLGSRSSGPVSNGFPWQFRLAAQLRTPVLMFVVIPISYAQAWYRTVRMWTRAHEWNGHGAMLAHTKNVEKVVEQIQAWIVADRPGKLRTARPAWASMSTKIGCKTDCYKIEMRHLNRILHVDEDNLTVSAEPFVTMGDLTHALMPRGMALQTHVEMETVTIGGAALGLGIETNSHRVGLFQESVLEYEIVDCTGKVHVVTEKSDAELFSLFRGLWVLLGSWFLSRCV